MDSRLKRGMRQVRQSLGFFCLIAAKSLEKRSAWRTHRPPPTPVLSPACKAEMPTRQDGETACNFL